MFQPVEQVIDRVGLGDGLKLSSNRANAAMEKLLSRLGIAAIEQPGITRDYPAYTIRVYLILQQPQAGIDTGFSAADYHVIISGLLDLGQVVEWHKGHAGVNFEAGSMVGGYAGFQISGVDRLARIGMKALPGQALLE